jgi:hypothetical protein
MHVYYWMRIPEMLQRWQETWTPQETSRLLWHPGTLVVSINKSLITHKTCCQCKKKKKRPHFWCKPP